jgi:hypothetical protein
VTPRDPKLRPVRDRHTGEYITHYDERTREVVRVKGGRLLRGKLTDAPEGYYTTNNRAPDGA